MQIEDIGRLALRVRQKSSFSVFGGASYACRSFISPIYVQYCVCIALIASSIHACVNSSFCEWKTYGCSLHRTEGRTGCGRVALWIIFLAEWAKWDENVAHTKGKSIQLWKELRKMKGNPFASFSSSSPTLFDVHKRSVRGGRKELKQLFEKRFQIIQFNRNRCVIAYTTRRRFKIASHATHFCLACR